MRLFRHYNTRNTIPMFHIAIPTGMDDIPMRIIGTTYRPADTPEQVEALRSFLIDEQNYPPNIQLI